MMTGFIDRIFSVGMMWPDAIGDKFKLAVRRPVTQFVFQFSLLAVNFL